MLASSRDEPDPQLISDKFYLVAKLDPDKVVAEALTMLDEDGLAGISTRRLAQRLAVEQPALYWHFSSKAALLAAMAEAAMAPHAKTPLPTPSDDWQLWFVDNMRSFRRTLLMRRDGARLHAGSRPRSDDAYRLERKIAFLAACGFDEQDAAMAMLAAGRFTLGSVLEEQADGADERLGSTAGPMLNHSAAFEFGLSLIVRGFAALTSGG